MSLLRRGVFFLLSLLLLIGLVGLAYGISFYLTLSSPAKVEKHLIASKFYSRFADNAIKQAEESTIGGLGPGQVSFSDPAIRQAAQQALNEQYLQEQGKSLLTNNYAWLEGKQDKPDFKVDLTPAREDFAKLAGQAVTAKLQALKVCTPEELAQAQSTGVTNPFNLACRPANVNPQDEGARVTRELSENSAFLSNPVITPTSLNPSEEDTQATPYYEKLSFLPALYQFNLKAPFIFGGLVLLSVLLMLFTARPKRKFTRRTGWVLLTAGLILVLNKVLADVVFNQIKKQTFQSGAIGPLEQSILDFLHRIEAEMVKVDLYFGVAYLVLAAVLFAILRRSKAGRRPAPKPVPAIERRQFAAPVPSGPSPKTGSPTRPAPKNAAGLDAGNMRPAGPKPPQQTVIDVAPSTRSTAPQLPKIKAKPQSPGGTRPRRKPPRLIQ